MVFCVGLSEEEEAFFRGGPVLYSQADMKLLSDHNKQTDRWAVSVHGHQPDTKIWLRSNNQLITTV